MKFHSYISNFKKIKIIIFFFISFLIIDRSISNLLFYFTNYSSLPHAELYSGNGETEIMILGNSRGYRSFDENLIEKKTGKKTKNYSLIGSSTLINEILINDYIEIYKNKPKIIIFEISNLLSDNAALKDLRVFGYKSKRISNILKNDYPKLYYSGLISNLFNFNNSTFFNSMQKIFVKYEYKGLTGKINKINLQIEKKTFIENEFSNKNISSLKRIVKLCNEKNIEIILVIAPLYYEILNNEMDEFNLWKKNIYKNIENIKIFDFSSNLKNKELFHDWKHININGINEFHQIFFDNKNISNLLLK